MKLSQSVKPISYFKAHASEVIRSLSKNRGTLVITQGGQAKVVLQDIHVFEKDRDTMAMLRILAQSQQSLKKGKVRKMDEVFKRIRARMAKKLS